MNPRVFREYDIRGNGDADFPDDFWGQFLHPFRKQREQLSDASPTSAETPTDRTAA